MNRPAESRLPTTAASPMLGRIARGPESPTAPAPPAPPGPAARQSYSSQWSFHRPVYLCERLIVPLHTLASTWGITEGLPVVMSDSVPIFECVGHRCSGP